MENEVINPKIEPSWKSVLEAEFRKEYFVDLKKFLVKEKSLHVVYPKGNNIFKAFELTPFNEVKVVILGQDPYHGEGQAHGLCFSVPKGIAKPPSLLNIFKEMNQDMGIAIPNHGNLEKWAKQGVLLLNATLTVRKQSPGSHQNQGWETFTDEVIRTISLQKKNIVFLLWGKYAQNKSPLIDSSKHLILFAAHPSPMSVFRGFFGCKHFSKTNEYLSKKNIPIIDWDTSTE